jgi:hypothetical protein
LPSPAGQLRHAVGSILSEKTFSGQFFLAIEMEFLQIVQSVGLRHGFSFWEFSQCELAGTAGLRRRGFIRPPPPPWDSTARVYPAPTPAVGFDSARLSGLHPRRGIRQRWFVRPPPPPWDSTALVCPAFTPAVGFDSAGLSGLHPPRPPLRKWGRERRCRTGWDGDEGGRARRGIAGLDNFATRRGRRVGGAGDAPFAERKATLMLTAQARPSNTQNEIVSVLNSQWSVVSGQLLEEGRRGASLRVPDTCNRSHRLRFGSMRASVTGDLAYASGSGQRERV